MKKFAIYAVVAVLFGGAGAWYFIHTSQLQLQPRSPPPPPPG